MNAGNEIERRLKRGLAVLQCSCINLKMEEGQKVALCTYQSPNHFLAIGQKFCGKRTPGLKPRELIEAFESAEIRGPLIGC